MNNFNFETILNEEGSVINIKKESPNNFILQTKDKTYNIIVVERLENKFKMLINGMLFEYNLQDKGKELINKLGLIKKDDLIGDDIKSPMPGLIKEVLVSKGDKINKGDSLVILEAMKMENILKSPKDNLSVSEVLVSPGQTVEKSAILIKF